MGTRAAKRKCRRTAYKFSLRTTRPRFSFYYFAMIQTVNMITMMAMNCSSTRSRMSCCDVLPEPPRIILMRPSRSTTATAPTAIGTATCDMKLAMADSLPSIDSDHVTREIDADQKIFR